MDVNSEFDTFEKDFNEMISEFQSLSSSESRLRELIRTESTRAESAEVARAAAERAAMDARANAAAANSAAAHSSQALVSIQDENVTIKMKLDLMECHHALFEGKNSELVVRIAELDKELQNLRPMQSAYGSLKNQYIELLNQINSATEHANSEFTHLGNELRRVEKCANAGTELRERARLAAAAHTRDRRFAAAELQHSSKALDAANVEISRLNSLVSDLQYRLSELSDVKSRVNIDKDPDQESLVEVRAALEAERAGAARLEQSLAAAVADNAVLAAKLHSIENTPLEQLTNSIPTPNRSSSICPIDSFLDE